MAFREYLKEKSNVVSVEEAGTWTDAGNYTDVLLKALEQAAKRKENLIVDVKRNGSNGIKVKLKDKDHEEMVASIVLDPTNRF